MKKRDSKIYYAIFDTRKEAMAFLSKTKRKIVAAGLEEKFYVLASIEAISWRFSITEKCTYELTYQIKYNNK